MSANKTFRRWTVFALGVVCTALGIALITQAGKGTSAVASPAFVLSQILPWSMGTFTVLINLGMMTLQAALLGRSFFPRQLLQLPASFAFGALLDLFRLLFACWVAPWLCLPAGCLILGLGVGLQRFGNIILLPSEGAVQAISQRLDVDFGQVKMYFDIVMVIVAAMLSWLFLGQIVGVREGTLFVAVLTGPISRLAYSLMTKGLSARLKK